MNINEIESRIKKLPDHLISEVLNYIEFLTNKCERKAMTKKEKQDKFKFDWEGGLSELKDQYTAVELQHKASEWR
ncbi:MAG: DUF2281 domain-containing protein [Planctomycetes bacterium]|nr:DUF2281 domain-containing protein [Planctomycetota bacterium]